MSGTLERIAKEMHRADDQYGPPASAQESLGVLLEEFHELREAIHQNDISAIRNEAIQVAAVAARLAEACGAESLTPFVLRSGF